MRTVTEEFRQAIQAYGRQQRIKIQFGDMVYTEEEIVSVNLHFDAALLTSVMRCLDLELCGIGGEDLAASLTGQNFTVCYGVHEEGDTECSWVDFGKFTVKSAEYNADTESVTVEAYDEMIRSMVPYTPVCVFPVSLKDYLAAIAARMNLELGTTNFTNCNVSVECEKYDDTYTYRDVLGEIAQAAAGTIAVKDGALCILYPEESSEELDPSNFSELTVGERYGPVNAVVLSRSPQEDNIYRRDETVDAWCEFRIENNQIMDSHREDFIDGIYEQLHGLSYYTFELKSFGYGWLDICDSITLTDLSGTPFHTIVLSQDLMIDQGISESFGAEIPSETKTEYEAASKSDRVLNQTILRVNKQEQTISSLVTKTENVENELTGQIENLKRSVETRMTEQEVSILIKEEIDGIDHVETSNGYVFGMDGLNISKSGEEMKNRIDHTGMYVDRGSENILTANNEGVNAINLTARQYLTIGKNSRFEDYGSGRTACFYVGG